MFLRENEVGSRLAPFLERGQSLLDLGAGTGYLSRWLQDRTRVRPTLADVVSYGNRDRSLPFLHLQDPFHVPVKDGAFDVVMLLSVFHHVASFDGQLRLLDEALRVCRMRLLVLEDTPENGRDLVLNMAWDWLLNRRHGVPTPFTFRPAHDWLKVFKERDLAVVASDTYRAMWPTLKSYPQTLFVLDR